MTCENVCKMVGFFIPTAHRSYNAVLASIWIRELQRRSIMRNMT